MLVWQANLGRGGEPGEYSRNLGRVLAAAGSRSVLGFQEIDEADTPHELAVLLRRTGRTHTIIGQKTAVPILVPKHLEILDWDVTIACKGLAGFTPTRHVVEVLLRLGPNLEVAVLNLHVPIDRPQTQTRRREAVQTLREQALAHRAAGHAVIWMADTNTHKGWPTILPGEKVVTNAGIDKAKAWAPADCVTTVTHRETVNLTIDGHDAHGARVMFKAA